MKHRFGLYQEQSLKLALTQELRQAIELLQYSSYELTTFLEERATENPLIELTYPSRDDFRKIPSKGISTNKRDDHWIENIEHKSVTIEDYLVQQLPIANLRNKESDILLYLIRNIDDNGYLTVTDDEVIKHFSIDEHEYHRLLSILHKLEPAGIAARNLKECILIQLERLPKKHPLAKELVETFFEPLAEKKWNIITKSKKIKMAEIQQIFDLIQTLNPRPGSIFIKDTSPYIIPDIIVKNEKEKWVIQLVEYGVPTIKMNEDYFIESNMHQDNRLEKFLTECRQEYDWIRKSIEQRRKTMLKVMETIIRFQSDFLHNGMKFLRPLTMRQVADAIGMHESTISRVVKNKYVQTPFGTISMKEFFPSGVVMDDEQTSDTLIKHELVRIIEIEDKKKPISDQQIVEKLEEKGIHVSRRTIAKYRSQLGIPSSSKRKRYD